MVSVKWKKKSLLRLVIVLFVLLFVITWTILEVNIDRRTGTKTAFGQNPEKDVEEDAYEQVENGIILRQSRRSQSLEEKKRNDRLLFRGDLPAPETHRENFEAENLLKDQRTSRNGKSVFWNFSRKEKNGYDLTAAGVKSERVKDTKGPDNPLVRAEDEKEFLSVGKEKFQRVYNRLYYNMTSFGEMNSSRPSLLIVAEARTGSSFLGDAFNQNPNVFYLFEPLYGVNPPSHNNGARALQFLKGILNFRDPRAVLYSHMKVAMMNFEAVENSSVYKAQNSPHPLIALYSKQLCQRMEANVKILQGLQFDTKIRNFMLRYEDLAKNPIETLKRAYNVAGITMMNSTLHWIRNHTEDAKITKSEERDEFSTKRNSKGVVDKWRLEMDRCIVDIIERSCRPVMELLGYKSVSWSPELQYDLNSSLSDE
ncbi:Carbohydrate sulfotransferase 3 [Acropora cervicornis]|uniref:Carbohydrate sulfotransferase 3 n=1 Tax=Acropora cervicornis TaxID=6130 RepID=A0AAD9QWQ8_ACRCE|nr:Carbohydrate sulfotransferase 3 [Acropora cervicornis]